MFEWKNYTKKPTEEDLEKVKEEWKELTPGQLLTIDEEYEGNCYCDIYEAINEVITKAQLDALITRFNKVVENNENDDDIYLPKYFQNGFFEEIEDEESIEDIGKEWVNHDLIYKDKFDRYFEYHYDGNCNWQNSGTINEVEPYTETITVTRYRSKG